jgi:hypothetical protein
LILAEVRSFTSILISSFMAVMLVCDTIVADQTVPVRSILGHVMKRRVNPVSYEFDFTIKKNLVERTNEKDSSLTGGLVQIVGGSSGNLVGRCVNRAFSVIFRHERNNDKTLPRIARIGSKLEGEFGRLSTGEQVG